MKQTEEKTELSEFQKDFLEFVRANSKMNLGAIDISKLALNADTTLDYYYVTYDFMATGVHIPREEVDEAQYRIEGIKIYHTVSYIW